MWRAKSYEQLLPEGIGLCYLEPCQVCQKEFVLVPCNYFAPRHDKKDSRLSIVFMAHPTGTIDEFVVVVGMGAGLTLSVGSFSSGWLIFPLASSVAGFVLSAALDKEYACCNGAIVVAAANSIIIAIVVVTAINVILFSTFFSIG